MSTLSAPREPFALSTVVSKLVAPWSHRCAGHHKKSGLQRNEAIREYKCPACPLSAAAHGVNAIHGTNYPGSVAGFVSHGCFRRYTQDIMDLCARVLRSLSCGECGAIARTNGRPDPWRNMTLKMVSLLTLGAAFKHRSLITSSLHSAPAQ